MSSRLSRATAEAFVAVAQFNTPQSPEGRSDLTSPACSALGRSHLCPVGSDSPIVFPRSRMSSKAMHERRLGRVSRGPRFHHYGVRSTRTPGLVRHLTRQCSHGPFLPTLARPRHHQLSGVVAWTRHRLVTTVPRRPLATVRLVSKECGSQGKGPYQDGHQRGGLTRSHLTRKPHANQPLNRPSL